MLYETGVVHLSQIIKKTFPVRSTAVDNPEAFLAAVEPVAGRVLVGLPHGSKLHGKARVAGLSKVGFLAIDSTPFRVCIDPDHGFYGLTLTLDAPFAISDGGKINTFNRDSAHLLHPDQKFDFRTHAKTSILGTNFFVDNFQDHACRLKGDAGTYRQSTDIRISLANPAASSLARYLIFIWGELNHGGGILNSELTAKEIEDGLIAALVWAIEDSRANYEPARLDRTDARIARAEEYLLAHLCDPVSRTELAQLAGVSIRTLSRAFLKRHGMGPMEFLRRRRLEAARIQFLLAEPGEINISEVALRYGFAQPSKFSAAYKAAFNEIPSETLRR